MRVPGSPLLVALLLLAAGCIAKDPPAETPGAELEPTSFAPEANATTARAGSNASATSSAPAASSGASASAPANASVAPPANTTPPVPPAPVVTRWDGTITGASPGPAAMAPVPVCCRVAESSGENTAPTFEVPAGVTAIVLELSWTQGQPPADLDLALDAPDVAEPLPPVEGTTPATRTGHWWTDGEGTPADTTGTARIVVTDPEALALTGTWTARVMPKGPANAVPFTLAVSLFSDAPVAADYTALSSE